jgi:hypothetical protein
MTTDTNQTIEFKFNVHGNRQPCTVCGCATDKGEVCAEGKTPKDETVRVCARCLKAGQKQIGARLKDHIRSLQEEVGWLLGLLGGLKVPSYAEWQAETEREALGWDRQEDLHYGARELLANRIDLDDRDACRRAEAENESEIYLDLLIKNAKWMKQKKEREDAFVGPGDHRPIADGELPF